MLIFPPDILPGVPVGGRGGVMTFGHPNDPQSDPERPQTFKNLTFS